MVSILECDTYGYCMNSGTISVSIRLSQSHQQIFNSPCKARIYVMYLVLDIIHLINIKKKINLAWNKNPREQCGENHGVLAQDVFDLRVFCCCKQHLCTFICQVGSCRLICNPSCFLGVILMNFFIRYREVLLLQCIFHLRCIAYDRVVVSENTRQRLDWTT